MPALDPDNWRDRDEPLNVDMDPETAMRLLLSVDPNAETVADDEDE